jgi:3-oxoacyl-[acyl-carrier protein] reductase
MKRTVIITGGTKGLGREIALAFARRGCFILALYAGDTAGAQEFDNVLRAPGLAGVSRKHDVCADDPSLWNHPEIQSADHLTLVHNACAPFAPVPLHQLTWADFEKNHRVAVQGAWTCSQPLIRLMLRKKTGTIITVLSAAVEGAPPKGFGAYVTAKHALRGFTLALAAEYAPRGVKIFSVSPGYMETSLTARWDDRMRQIIRENADRLTHPAAAAAQIVALAENAATPGTGENYPL